ncbi:MAG TPA: 23S rRNA (adenine(2503)-C(2))-methyltransferase RlmN [Candidatus Cloacimonadota bacterium]|nr:23S rRNA (adenine(2503)-C(2))-methyltransferase RlmN [Candidatus Cloacimonadota bacterium]
MLNSIYGIYPPDLLLLLGKDFPAYRGKQLLDWLYRKFVFDPELMTNLPAGFREHLSRSFDFSVPAIDQELLSSDGSRKFRLVLADGARIEMVLMPEAKKLTLCVSSQVGCARACGFCATGRMGLTRNLQTHEIVQQVLLARKIAGTPITNLVFMGMGEPMDNLDSVLDALKLLQHDSTLKFSPRRTTLSTCGIVPGIHRLTESGVKVKLAVSLNAASDDIRGALMPVNLKYPLDILKKSLLNYQRRSPFRITLEYILIPDVNMSGKDLKQLRKFCSDLSCKINFIPYNPVPALPYRSPTEAEINAFLKAAQDIPQAITLRRSKGSDILGACGQLAARNKEA